MTIRPIITAPDPRLAICSEEIERVDDEIRLLMDDMVDTMREADGIGLAAVQVGVHKRVLVMEIPDDSGRSQLYFMANPKIIARSEEENIYEEGCLSFPEQLGMVKRPKQVTIEYLDRNDTLQQLACEGLLATCVQHEIDHLNGVVFIDHLSMMRKHRIMEAVRKARKIQKRKTAHSG